MKNPMNFQKMLAEYDFSYQIDREQLQIIGKALSKLDPDMTVENLMDVCVVASKFLRWVLDWYEAG